MSSPAEQAFSFAQETSKQVLTLSTAIIGITVALLGSLKEGASPHSLTYLHDAWICAGLSVLFGVVTLMALTGHLGRDTKPAADMIYSGNVRWAYGLQFLTFLVALGFTIAFGISTS
jgi:hypothetical protein